MRSTFAILLAIISVGCCYGVSTVPQDPELDKKVTLAVKGEALIDIMSLLQEQTDVKLRAAPVADQKATIFVDDKPLRQVMEGLETIFDYHWRTKTYDDVKYYELYEDPKNQRDREEAWKTATEKAWKELDADLDRLSQLSGKTPAELEAMRVELEPLMSKNPSQVDQERYGVLKRLIGEPMTGPTVRLFRGLSSRAREAFQTGMLVCFDTDTSDSEWKLSPSLTSDLVAQFQQKFTTGDGVELDEPDAVNVKFQSNAQQDYVQANAYITARWQGGYTSRQVFLSQKSIPQYRPELKPIDLPQVKNDELFEKKISLTTAELARAAAFPWQSESNPNPWVSRSDVLALIHQKLGLQIIADHYSLWRNQPPYPEQPLKDVLESVQNWWPGQSPRGWDGTFLYMRVTDPRQCDETEIPNRLVRKWQAKYAKQGFLGLDDLADIMVSLTQKQLDQIRWQARFHRIGDANGLQLPDVLRIYGVLTSSQRRETFAGGTPVASFTPQQYQVLSDYLDGRLPYRQPYRFFDDKPRAGIYDEGTRVDKPEPPPDPPPPVPVSVSIKQDNTNDTFIYMIVGKDGSYSERWGGGKTFEEAWQLALQADPKSEKKYLIRQRNVNYMVTFQLSDGNNRSDGFNLQFRQTYADVERQ